MKCQHCKKDFLEKEIHEHHTHPRFMDNKKGLGKKVYLCEKCHNILHSIIPSIIWRIVYNKERCIEEVKKYTDDYIK